MDLPDRTFSSLLLRNELIRGDETVPHIPDPRELPQLIS
jgi:hypothetical protein